MLKRTVLTLALASALSPALASPPPAGITWRDQAARPAPIAADRDEETGRFQRFVIRREPGAIADGPRDVLIDRDEADGPTRVIIRRERRDDFEASDRHRGILGAHHDGLDADHEHMDNDGDQAGSYRDEWIDEGRDYPAGDEHGADRSSDQSDHHASNGPVHGYAQGSCCPGGMITETITTTTTYPPSVERHVSYGHVAEHRPVRIGKRKLRRR